MTYAELTAAAWMDLDDDEARRVALAIADAHGLRLTGLGAHEYAGRVHRTALFDRAGLAFALVPGGRVTLGYDGAAFTPTAAQAADYAQTVDEYNAPDLAEYLDGYTSPVRTVELPASLVAVEALDACRIELGPEDERVRDLVGSSGARPGGGIRTYTAGGGLEVRFDGSGKVAGARLVRPTSYDEAVQALIALGLRPATPDEWEYACGAGARTLFRWGDDTPAENPYDLPNGPHRRPNLWGLAIGQDPYRHEWTAQREILCGGDGGSAICGGAGDFFSWTTLATAYRNAEFAEEMNTEDAYVDEVLLRPVIDLV
ncbi:hypothetical protein [Catellatospora coxensis]|uniref:Formylglycine-generating enzyme required for sulfatase activity n=1 Tax=Catellatospora coxensis TaxID=310354 RepID=A0A8J3KWX2_9ACTN|nr:hypothetical protein [Catellatospora coxensis]GIG07648.1 hypothetical protein Cco03nite_43480 [Catellatospora coxensis]